MIARTSVPGQAFDNPKRNWSHHMSVRECTEARPYSMRIPVGTASPVNCRQIYGAVCGPPYGKVRSPECLQCLQFQDTRQM